MIAFVSIYLAAFGLFSLIGGIIGFNKAGSRASLAAGGVSGLLLIASGALAGIDHKVMFGMIMGLVVCLLLAGRFVPNFLKTKKVMPAGLMALFSVVGLGLTAYALYAAR